MTPTINSVKESPPQLIAYRVPRIQVTHIQNISQLGQTLSFKIVLGGDPGVGTTKLCFVIEKKPFSFEHSFFGYDEIHSKAPDGAMAGLSSFRSGILNARRRTAVFAQHRHLPCLLFHSGSKVSGECGFQRSDRSAGRESDYGQVCE